MSCIAIIPCYPFKLRNAVSYGCEFRSRHLADPAEHGKPSEKGNIYDAVSPIKFVQHVRTPTLIVHSEE